VGEEYLRIVSWSYMASGVIFVASSMFQAMGNTIPSLVSSFTAHRGDGNPGAVPLDAAGIQPALGVVVVGGDGLRADDAEPAAAPPRVPPAAGVCRRTLQLRQRLSDLSVVGLVARVVEDLAIGDRAVRSMTKDARLAMSFNPIMSGLTTAVLAMTVLL
jgi:hypothetical protein